MSIRKKLVIASIFSLAFPAGANTPVPVADLEAFHGLSAGLIADLGLDLPQEELGTEGSAAKGNYFLQAGDRISFNYRILTNESSLVDENDAFSDYAYVALGNYAEILYSVPTDSTIGFSQSTLENFAWQSDGLLFSMVLPDSYVKGDYDFGLGIVDYGDLLVNSGLLVDNLQLFRGTDLITSEGFENNFDLVSFTIGDASIVDNSFGIAAPEGSKQLLLTTGLSSVPLPATGWLMISALLGLISFKRKPESL